MLSFPQGTEMFQFPQFPLPALCVQTGVPPDEGWWVSPFGYPRINAYSAAPRGFSQPVTSFFGVRRQGIHHWLFVAWVYRYSDSKKQITAPGATPARAHLRCPQVLDARASLFSSQCAGPPTRVKAARRRPEPSRAPWQQNRGRAVDQNQVGGFHYP